MISDTFGLWVWKYIFKSFGGGGAKNEAVFGQIAGFFWKIGQKQGGELWVEQLATAAKHLRNDFSEGVGAYLAFGVCGTHFGLIE